MNKEIFTRKSCFYNRHSLYALKDFVNTYSFMVVLYTLRCDKNTKPFKNKFIVLLFLRCFLTKGFKRNEMTAPQKCLKLIVPQF